MKRAATTWLFSLLLLCCLAGCATRAPVRVPEQRSFTTLPDPDPQLYQIYIDSDGDLLDPVTEQPVVNEHDYLSNLFAHFRAMRQRRPGLELAVFIHGGLNTFENATERVNRVKQRMLKDCKYPLFISWNSAAPGNYADHLFRLRRGISSPRLGPLTSPFVLAEDVLRSLVRVPASTYNVLFGQNSVSVAYLSKEEEAAALGLHWLVEANEFQIHNTGAASGHTAADFATIANPAKLISAPFVDGLGTGAWNSLLRRTDLVLRRLRTFEGQAGAETAASLFFERWQRENPELPILLIAHSMGTVIANNIVAKYPSLHFEHIVYMAAACRTKDLEYVIAPYLERHPSAHFYNLSLNAYRDILEINFYDFLPRGSLLIWIDQVLANVNSFQDRTAGFWFNTVRSAHQVFRRTDVRKRVHLTQFGIADGSPQEHTAFGDYPFWREAFWLGDAAAQARAP
jgi:pimeloyl-ACP methyl ester carboxylesterase